MKFLSILLFLLRALLDLRPKYVDDVFWKSSYIKNAYTIYTINNNKRIKIYCTCIFDNFYNDDKYYYNQILDIVIVIILKRHVFYNLHTMYRDCNVHKHWRMMLMKW